MVLPQNFVPTSLKVKKLLLQQLSHGNIIDCYTVHHHFVTSLNVTEPVVSAFFILNCSVGQMLNHTWCPGTVPEYYSRWTLM